jgi:hypothetical protein
MRICRVAVCVVGVVCICVFFGCKKSIPGGGEARDRAGGDSPVEVAKADETASEFKFAEGTKVMAGDEPINGEVGHLVPCVVDWNNDGKKDLVVGQFGSGAIRLYLNGGTDAAPVFGESTMLEAGGKPIKLDAG